jgi:hypothetical protein
MARMGLGILWCGWFAAFACTEANPAYEPDGGGDAEVADTDGTVPDIGDGDARDDARPDDGAGEVPDVLPDDGGDEGRDAPPDDAADVPDVTETGPICGDGVVDTGEECDDSSGFCAGCALTAPAGWTRCTDAEGNVAFFAVEAWAGDHTQLDYRDRCRAVLDALAPVGFADEGLAAIYDANLWACVEPLLATGTQYWIGLSQDMAATDYAEPDGGWYWQGWDGTSWEDIAPFDPANGFITGSFDNGGGTGTGDCTRLQSGGGGWSAMDYSCTTATNWSGVCMLRY